MESDDEKENEVLNDTQDSRRSSLGSSRRESATSVTSTATDSRNTKKETVELRGEPVQILCLRCMTLLYKSYPSIGAFSDVPHLVWCLDATKSIPLR